MKSFTYAKSERALVCAAALLLVVAATAGAAKALTGTDSVTFARTAPAAEPTLRDFTSASGAAIPAIGDGSGYGGMRISHPRECDVAQGISTECVFLD